MAKLSTKERNALPDSAFAGPDRSYPVQDRAHAAAAKSRAAQFASPDEKKRIDAKANKVLGAKNGAVVKKGKEGSKAEEASESKEEAKREGDKPRFGNLTKAKGGYVSKSSEKIAAGYADMKKAANGYVSEGNRPRGSAKPGVTVVNNKDEKDKALDRLEGRS